MRLLKWMLICGVSLGMTRQQSDTLRYERSLLLETTSETSANVSIGDLDGDGNLDLVLAKGRHWPLVDRVLLGDGRGHIGAAYDLSTVSDRSYSGSLADIDGDGNLDVVISNDAPDPNLVYFNDGKGHFTVGSEYGLAVWPTRNGVDCIAFSREPATTVTPADIDRDGRVDLVVPHRDGGQSKVYRFGVGLRGEAPSPILFGPPDAGFRMAEVADFDGDSLPDIVAIDERRGASIYFGKSGPSFSPALQVSGGKPPPYALAVADLNADGRPDIIVGHVESPSAIYFNDGISRS
jgi:hypothetical protein